MKLHKKTVLKSLSVLLILIAFCTILDRYIYPLPKNMLFKDHSHFIYSRDGRLLNCFASYDHFWRKPIRIDKISLNLIKSVIACEDRWFYYHPGFNPVSLVSAAIADLKSGRIIRGGSTITMQIARMMEPKARTIKNKLFEICRAVQLEMHYSKNELLEIYFNLVPYGGNIEGVGAATYFYFGKSPEQLTLSEAAILTAIPTSPNQFRPDLVPDNCRFRRDRILEYLHKEDVISSTEYAGAKDEEIPNRRTNRPFLAPQFCQSMLSLYTSGSDIHTTIDYQKQSLCERLAYTHQQALIEKGIYNLAVVVLDNKTGDVLAVVGSPDFVDSVHSGQINGIMARRSPGSALKPFIYALGFETGEITPDSRIDDIPVTYAGYIPENYDEEYHGVVPVTEALIQSLNVPAVNLTKRVGLQKFYDLLKSAGMGSLEKKYYEYGLPLVLGGCEVTLLELSNMYATLAREGNYRPVRMLKDDRIDKGRQILSEETCYIISGILANLQRTEMNSSWEFTKDQPTIAWKTGTSYGRKDAWTIGYNPQYTVGVWAGNFSGQGTPYLVGVEVASPLMFAIFREVTKGTELKWFEPPPGIGFREVCTISGMVPNGSCPATKQESYIIQVSDATPCDIHKIVTIDHRSGHMLCRACSYSAHKIDTVVVEQWPARLSNWLLSQGLTKPLPQHNPYCTGILADDAPVIISPEKNGVYELLAATPLEFQKILFKASAALGSNRIHWFLDNKLYATSEGGSQLFYLPESGAHRLMCVDDLGRSSQISFEVR